MKLSIEQAWGVFISGLLAVVCLVLYSRAFQQRKLKAQQKTKQKEERRQRQLADQQLNIGNRIFNALLVAAKENPTGEISVVKNDNNAGGYYVLVRHECQDMIRHRRPAFDVHINLSNEKGIGVYPGGYSPMGYYDTDEGSLTALIRELQHKTRTFGISGRY